MNSHFLELLESSSLPGLSILIKSKQIIVKIVWFIFIVFLMSLSIKCVIETIKTYYEYQVVTNINVISEQTLPFPTVSFCMNSKIKPNISNLNNVLLSCNFEQSTCNSSDFEIQYYPDKSFSMCLRFNSGKNFFNESTTIRNIKRKGPRLGFNVFFNTTNLNNLLFPESKIMAYMNNASDMFLPLRAYNSIQSNGNFLIRGSNLIKMEIDLIEKLSEPYNNCVKKDTTDFISDFFQYFIRNKMTYLQSDCFDLCNLEMIKNACNCTDRIGSQSECFDNSLDCIEKRNSDYESQKNQFSLQCTKSCPPECDFINYKTYVSYLGPINADWQKRFPGVLNEHLYQVGVYYEKLEYTLINQLEKMSTFDFASSVGGILGLFIGFSFITLVEIIEIISELIGYYLSNKLKKTINPNETKESGSNETKDC